MNPLIDPLPAAPVLAAVDFSIHSRRALVYAARLAQLLDRPLVVVHVAHETPDPAGRYRRDPKGATIPLSELAESLLSSFVAQGRAKHPELRALESARLGVVSGVPGQRIPELAEHLDAAMVVVGSRGLRGLAGWWQGSVSQTLARECPRPLVVVRNPCCLANSMPAASVGRTLLPPKRHRERLAISGGAVAA